MTDREEIRRYSEVSQKEDIAKSTMYDDKGRFLPIMNFQLQMSHPVREDIYQYFVNE